MSLSNANSSGPTPGTLWERVAFAWRVIQLRLRMVVVLAALAVVLVGWQKFQDWADRIAGAWGAAAQASGGVSPDTEYFCPMCPGVVTQWPEKCPVCKMPLVRRTRGDAALLPEGVLARMQLSPQRIQLAGIQTSLVGYAPLTRRLELRAIASAAAEGADRADGAGVGAMRAVARVARGEVREFEVGDRVEWNEGGADAEGTVGRIERIEGGERAGDEVELTLSWPAGGRPWAAGTELRVTLVKPVAELAPFRSQPRRAPALTERSVRTLYHCSEHAEYWYDAPGQCPFDERALEGVRLAENQRVEWWCPAHAQETSGEPGQCAQCGDCGKLPRITTYHPDGQVVTAPASAVIELAGRPVVYVERMPGMFDGVPVQVGPRCGDQVAIAVGLQPGERVVTAGAFLLDAESRLNAGVASTYFGAGGQRGAAGSVTRPTLESAGDEVTAKLSPAQRAWAEWQRVCPVTKLPLGEMGELDRVKVRGRWIFLCCEGCRGGIAESSIESPQAE